MIAHVTMNVPGMLPRIVETPSVLIITASDITKPADAVPILHVPTPLHAAALLAAAIFIVRQQFGETAVRTAHEIAATMTTTGVIR